MIHFTYGNMFELPADVLVNAVNCVGVMGKGVALEFKKRCPKLHRAYRQACYNGHLLPGGVFPWKGPDGILVLNVATKYDWRHKSRYCYILDGLNAIRMILQSLPKQRVHIPALGCGNGGLSWEIVRGMIQNALEDVDCDVWVFEPMQDEN